MSNTLRVLLIDNSPEDRILAMRELRREIPDLQVEQITGAEEFSQALEGGNFDLVLTDYRLQWADGLEVLRAVKARWPERPVIMLTDTSTEEIALEAMEAGLDDYVLKSPQHFARLPIVARSALKRAQQCQALRETEARCRGLFDGMPVGIYRTAPEGQALDANPALVQMLGYPDREALLAVNAADVYANAADRRRWQAMMEHKGVVHEFEAQLRRRDGTTIWVQDSARAVRDSDGRVLYYEGVMEDITQRKQAEEALRRERRLSQSIIETTPALVVGLDTDGRITMFNQACEKLTGYGADEAIGRVIWEFLIPEQFVPEIQEVFARLQADVLPSKHENPWLTRDGHERWVTWTNTNIKDEAGNVVAIVSIGIDLAEFRQMQQALERRNWELQALVEAGQVLSGTLDLDEVLDHVLDVIQKKFNLASVSFSSYDAATQTLEIRAQHYDNPAHQIGQIGDRRTRDQHPYSSRALDTGRLVCEPDLWNAPHISKERQDEARTLNIRSVVEVPLIAKGRPVGVLHLRAFENPRFFTDEELAFARAIAPAAAAAIDNAQLYGSLTQRMEEISALYHAGQVLTGVIDMEQLLNFVVEAAVAMLPHAERGAIQLHDEERNALVTQTGQQFSIWNEYRSIA